MSGPKVVRIVSREEMEIIKNTQITLLKAEILLLKKFSEMHSLLSDGLLEGVDERVAEYEKMDASNYQRFQNEIPVQITFLRDERKRLQKKVVEAKVQEKQRQARLYDAYETLVGAFESKGLEVPQQLQELSNNLKKVSIEKLEQALDDSFHQLTSNNKNKEELSIEQQEIRNRLIKGGSVQSLSQWMNENNLKPVRELFERLDHLIAELQILEGDENVIASFLERADTVFQEESESRKKLIVDSLTLDIASYVKNLKEISSLLEEINALIKEIEAITVACQDQRLEQLKQASEISDIGELKKLLTAGKLLRDEIFNNSAAISRRSAILNGLKSLGYDVNEGLNTAWVENGRLVVRKNDASNYGVEFGGPAGLERCQIRVVADESTKGQRTKSDDLSEEKTWCEDFGLLREKILDQGAAIEIDMVHEPGQIALKELSFDSKEWEHQQKGDLKGQTRLK